MTFILFDNNLSPKIAQALTGTYNSVYHVTEVGLESEEDSKIWSFVKERAGAIITKDADFFHLLNRYSHPPKVIWIRTGNSTTKQMIQLLTDKHSTIGEFLANDALGLLELY